MAGEVFCSHHPRKEPSMLNQNSFCGKQSCYEVVSIRKLSFEILAGGNTWFNSPAGVLQKCSSSCKGTDF